MVDVSHIAATGSALFSDLLGQRKAKNLLAKSLGSGRIAHAYLFRGPDGVGKKLFAQAVAEALNCRNEGPVSSCGECASCRKFHSGSHPDFHVESPEKGAIKIDRVRELTRSLSYPPYESIRRVVVMEDVHTMRVEAANSLLKTLEEPPEDNVLILTAESSKSVLPTILSRCQVVSFFPLSTDETETILRTKHDFSDEESRIFAQLSEGSPGRALILHQYEMVDLWKRVNEVLSDPRFRAEAEVGEVLKLAEQMAGLKDNLLSFFGLLRLSLRDEMLNVEGDAREVESIGAKFEAINDAERQLARNCNRSLVCEILLFRLQ